MNTFDPADIKEIFKPAKTSTKTENGQVTIIGGSTLFHGAPLFSLTTASRIVDMVFFASPEKSIGEVANKIKSRLFSFIWVAWDDLDEYIEKSDACLIGPGLMRSEETCELTREILKKYQGKKWVIDAGSLQVMDANWIPQGSILTPNQKEYQRLFNSELRITNYELCEENVDDVQKNARKYKCVIVLKGPTTIIASPDDVVLVEGGNAGLTKGGSGDVEAGLTVALMAKNSAFLAASAASYIVKKTADVLYAEKGTFYNSDDLANKIPEVLNNILLFPQDLR
jgi:NAD(P)H-hydrate epimerase